MYLDGTCSVVSDSDSDCVGLLSDATIQCELVAYLYRYLRYNYVNIILIFLFFSFFIPFP